MLAMTVSYPPSRYFWAASKHPLCLAASLGGNAAATIAVAAIIVVVV